MPHHSLLVSLQRPGEPLDSDVSVAQAFISCMNFPSAFFVNLKDEA